jgi:hypothetical protein
MNVAQRGVAFKTLCVIALLASGWAAHAIATKKARMLRREEVAQIWLGISEDELYVVRLSLSQDGKGSGGYIFVDDKPFLFRIADWKYQAGKISITPESPEHARSGLRGFTGEISGIAMELTMSGQDWHRHLSLRRESQMEHRWNMLKEAMSMDSR